MNANFCDMTVLTKKAQDLKSQRCESGLLMWSITEFTRLCWCYFLFLLWVQIDSIENRITAAKMPDQKCNSKIKKMGKTVPNVIKFYFCFKKI